MQTGSNAEAKGLEQATAWCTDNTCSHKRLTVCGCGRSRLCWGACSKILQEAPLQ